jgi:excisionase family DNA binding protein
VTTQRVGSPRIVKRGQNPVDNQRLGEPLGENALLTERELADCLKVSLTTVRRLRRTGKGPPVVWVGRQPRYRKQDVDAWIAAGGGKA